MKPLLLVVLVFAGIIITSVPVEGAQITDAFSRILINGVQTISARSYNDFFNIIEGANIDVTTSGNSITIAAVGVGAGNATSLKDLGDVSNNINSTKGNVFVANGTHYNGVRVGSNGQVLTADSSKQMGVVWSTPASGSTLKVDNQTAQRDRFLQGLNNATGDWTTRIFSIDNRTQTKDQFVQGINNVTGAITTIQFTIGTRTCSGTDKVSAINNITGAVTCTADVSGGSSNGILTKRWGSFTPTSATTVLSGQMVTSATLEGTETWTYNTTRGVSAISATTGTGGLRYAGIQQNATNFNIFRGDQNSLMYIESAPSPSQFAGSRFAYIFKSTQQILPRSDTIVNAISAFGICKRTTDTNYMRCENDGSGTGTYTSLGVAANTQWHTIKIYATSSGTSWCVELDGGTASCTSVDIPAATTRMWWQAIINQNPSTTSKTIWYGYVYVQNDK